MGQARVYEAQIYEVVCTDPRFSDVKYIGLDTKRDPNYLGSSVVIKWLIDYLGRDSFKKNILEEVSGTMPHLCEVEQGYIDRANAVENPAYINRNGRSTEDSKEDRVTLDLVLKCDNSGLRSILKDVDELIAKSIRPKTHAKALLISSIVKILGYALACYDEPELTYSPTKGYCSLDYDEVESLLSGLKSCGVIDYTSNKVYPSMWLYQKLAELGLLPEDFYY